MFDIFAPIEVYDRVMGNDKIKNKFLGYFWRVATIYAALFGAVFVLLSLVSGGSVWKDVTTAQVLGSLLIVLIVCVGYPLFSYRLVSRKSKSAEEDK